MKLHLAWSLEGGDGDLFAGDALDADGGVVGRLCERDRPLRHRWRILRQHPPCRRDAALATETLTARVKRRRSGSPAMTGAPDV